MGFGIMDVLSGGLNRGLKKELGNVAATPPRNLSSEIDKILGQSGRFYENASVYGPQYGKLATDIFGQAVPSINSVLNSANTATRASQLGDLQSFGAGTTDAIRAINPSQTQLYDQLVQRAQSQLAAGNRLTPGQTFSATNPIRSDWAARGFSSDSLPVGLDEAVALSRTGDNMQQQRQQFAAGVADMGNQFYTQPTIGSILGAGSNAGQYAPMALNAGQDATQGLMAYGSDLFNTNFNEQATRNIADYNGRAGLMGSAMSY